MIEIKGSPYEYSESQKDTLDKIARRVRELRKGGSLAGEALLNLRKYFRIKSIYHSNAIEGNALDQGETRLVVEEGMTLTGKSLKDQAEARNLGEAVDYLEELVKRRDGPITEADIRQLHALVLKGVDDAHAGVYRQLPVEISGSGFSPPGPESVAAEMGDFGRWLGAASVVADDGVAAAEGLLTAAVAHTWFVCIHPFSTAMVVSHGY